MEGSRQAVIFLPAEGVCTDLEQGVGETREEGVSCGSSRSSLSTEQEITIQSKMSTTETAFYLFCNVSQSGLSVISL